MCLYPTIRKNKKYVMNKKNGGNIPTVRDDRVLYIPTGCGNCIECRKQKARNWQLRLLEEIKENKNGKFVTLTFSNESILKLIKYEKTCTDINTGKKFKLRLDKLKGYELDNEIAIVALRLFNERWRKKTGKALRHWMVTELGHNGTENIHLHGIVWTDENIETIAKIWGYGWIWPREKTDIRKNYVNAQTVNYIIKYVTKVDPKHITYKSRILPSPGIGKQYTENYNSYINKYNGKKTVETYKSDNGYNIAMPSYWRNKIYTDEEREQLWLQRLDKEERYVMGEKIDISKGTEELDKLVKYYRKLNTILGYGNDEKNEDRKEYEQQRRELMIKTRIAKTMIKEGGWANTAKTSDILDAINEMKNTVNSIHSGTRPAKTAATEKEEAKLYIEE